MPFDWTDFLILAEKLLQSDGEAEQRSAISRAYYSIFNVAFQRAMDNNCRLDADASGGLHKKCWGYYRKGPDSLCVQLGIDGSRFSEQRVRADYKKGEYRRLKEDATKFIGEVKQFKAKLAALDPRYPSP